nr:ABC transporter permease [Fundidesulfovibrio terrae]
MPAAPPVTRSSSGGPQNVLALAKRLLIKSLWLAVVFLGITLVSFWVIHLAPGKPTDLQTDLNPLITPEAVARLEKLYGLDQPVHVQYWLWLGRLAKFDFGNALTGDRRPVWDKIKERLPLTFGMNMAALILTLSLSIPIGVSAAARQNGLFDRASTVFVFFGFAMPGFWLALLLMLGLGIAWPVLPISGLTSLDHAQMPWWRQIQDVCAHLAMPMFIYVFGGLAGMSRYMRSAMLEVLRQDYILTARAKGLPESAVIYRHALRNALLPVITLLGLSIPGLIGGSVIIEQIFSLPGLGQLFYQAVMSRDYPLIMANLVLGAVLTLAGNMLADVGYAFADPRIRSGGGRG